MTWAAVGVGAAVVVGGLVQSDASKSASNKQQAGTQAGIDEQKRQFTLTQSQTAPFASAGKSAITELQKELGIGTPSQVAPDGPSAVLRGNLAFDQQGNYLGRFGMGDSYGQTLEQIAPTWGVNSVKDESGNLAWSKPGAAPGTPAPGTAATTPATAPLSRKFSVSDFWNDPVVQLGYQSGLDLGTKALKNAAPLTTGLDSGAALKELTQFGTDYTGRTMAAGSQARFVGDQTNQFNRLAAMAGIGQTAVSTDASAGANAANNTSGLLAANANAQGAAKIAGANSFSGGLNSISNYWQQQQMMDRLDKNRTNTTGYNNPTSSSTWAE